MRIAVVSMVLDDPTSVQKEVNEVIGSYKDIIKMLFGGVTLSYVDVQNGNSMGYQVVDDVVNYIVQPQSTKNRVYINKKRL